MELKISKTQMELAIKVLERRAAKLDDFAMFRGIPAKEFDKEHLVMLCNLFANEWRETQVKYFATELSAAYDNLYKHSLWRKIWNRIKSWA